MYDFSVVSLGKKSYLDVSLRNYKAWAIKAEKFTFTFDLFII